MAGTASSGLPAWLEPKPPLPAPPLTRDQGCILWTPKAKTAPHLVERSQDILQGRGTACDTHTLSLPPTPGSLLADGQGKRGALQ